MALEGARARVHFIREHFVGICLGLLALILIVVTLVGCGPDNSAVSGMSSTASGSASGSAMSTPGSSETSTKDGSSSVPGTSSGTDPMSGLPTITESELPAQARSTLTLIDRGGPFPYPRNDGVVYNNYNKVLPKHQRGYYHEYTVKTPGISSRGPRRIVTGEAGEFYYTADHYDSFERIVR